MKRLLNRRARGIHATGLAPGVPTHISRRARSNIDLLIAAHDIQDVLFFKEIWTSRRRPDRFGLRIEQSKWFVAFSWEPAFGAKDISIERW
jgi:hypothetical protein